MSGFRTKEEHERLKAEGEARLLGVRDGANGYPRNRIMLESDQAVSYRDGYDDGIRKAAQS